MTVIDSEKKPIRGRKEYKQQTIEFIFVSSSCHYNNSVGSSKMVHQVKVHIAQAWQPEFNRYNPYKDGRKEPTSQSCSLTYSHTITINFLKKITSAIISKIGQSALPGFSWRYLHPRPGIVNICPYTSL